jgi:lipid-binding SYLF domain-containing protein
LVVASALALLLAAEVASARTAAKRTPSEEQALVNHAQATLARFRSDPGLTGFRENESASRAVLIIPKAVRAGLIFGGSGGPGVVVARSGGSWNGPSFYTLATASFGIQLGVDVSEIVVLVMTQRGLDALLAPSVRTGMDASIAAGPVGIGIGRPPRPDTDFVYYARSKGFYGGVSLEGARIQPDGEANDAYYGRLASAREILIRGSFHNGGARRLIETVEGSTRMARR